MKLPHLTFAPPFSPFVPSHALRLRPPRTPRQLFLTHAKMTRTLQGNVKQGVVPNRTPSPPHTFAIAPMMEVTDRHFRTLARLISCYSTLYTEMVVDKTLIHNPVVRQHALRIPTIQSGTPLVLQLGGSNPEELAQASKIVREGGYEYTEINLNCGCPSPKVAGKGCFGAALMREPALVAEACSRIAEHATVPVTVKCRLGVDDDDSYESLHAFVKTVSEQGGVRHFIVHARNAILGGLSPAQNRSIPPLRYHFVHRLMRDFPGLTFSINGGFKKMADIRAQLEMGVDGVMVGREVMDHPWRLLSDVDNLLYGVPRLDENGMPISRRWVLKRYLEYAEGEVGQGCSVRSVVRPVVGLFGGERNGKRFRRALDEGLSNGLAATEIVNKACTELDDETLDAVAPSMRVAVVDEFAQGCGEPVVTVGVLGAVASE